MRLEGEAEASLHEVLQAILGLLDWITSALGAHLRILSKAEQKDMTYVSEE